MSIEAHLAELERRHRALEAEIADARSHPSVDDLQIVELKRRKLLVKDEIGRLQLAPVVRWGGVVAELGLGRRSTRIEGGGRLTKKKGEGPMRRLLQAAVAAAVAVALCGHGFAQEFPAHTITLIVPYPP